MRPCGIYDRNYKESLMWVRTPAQRALVVISVIGVFMIPMAIRNTYLLSIINYIGITIIALYGLSILTGYTGQISIGHTAFIAVGSYTSAILTERLGFSCWVSMFFAILASGMVSLIFGIPALRIKGFYLAITTIAAQFIILWCIVHPLGGLSNSAAGMRVPPLQVNNVVLSTQPMMFYPIWFFVILSTYIAKNITRTRVGRAFCAIRDNDLAAEVMGINVFKYKVLAFFISGCFAGLSGSLWAHWSRWVAPDFFDLMGSIWFLGMLIIGGMGSNVGVWFGAIIVRGLMEALTYLASWLGSILPAVELGGRVGLPPLVFGMIIILTLIYEPRGLAHRWEKFKSLYRIWPLPYL